MRLWRVTAGSALSLAVTLALPSLAQAHDGCYYGYGYHPLGQYAPYGYGYHPGYYGYPSGFYLRFGYGYPVYYRRPFLRPFFSAGRLHRFHHFRHHRPFRGFAVPRR